MSQPNDTPFVPSGTDPKPNNQPITLADALARAEEYAQQIENARQNAIQEIKSARFRGYSKEFLYERRAILSEQQGLFTPLLTLLRQLAAAAPRYRVDVSTDAGATWELGVAWFKTRDMITATIIHNIDGQGAWVIEPHELSDTYLVSRGIGTPVIRRYRVVDTQEAK